MLKKPIAAAALAFVAATLFLTAGPPVDACISYIGWVADLGPAHAPAAQPAPKPAGTARMLYDFTKPFGTLIVETPKLKDVVRIELRATRHADDLSGPVIAVVYDAKKDGPYRGALTRVLTPSDIIPQTSPKIGTVAEVGTAIFHNGAVVAVCTRANPQGAFAGVIKPHKILVYSDARGGFHDSKLHRQAAPGGRH